MILPEFLAEYERIWSEPPPRFSEWHQRTLTFFRSLPDGRTLQIGTSTYWRSRAEPSNTAIVDARTGECWGRVWENDGWWGTVLRASPDSAPLWTDDVPGSFLIPGYDHRLVLVGMDPPALMWELECLLRLFPEGNNMNIAILERGGAPLAQSPEAQ